MLVVVLFWWGNYTATSFERSEHTPFLSTWSSFINSVNYHIERSLCVSWLKSRCRQDHWEFHRRLQWDFTCAAVPDAPPQGGSSLVLPRIPGFSFELGLFRQPASSRVSQPLLARGRCSLPPAGPQAGTSAPTLPQQMELGAVTRGAWGWDAAVSLSASQQTLPERTGFKSLIQQKNL